MRALDTGNTAVSPSPCTQPSPGCHESLKLQRKACRFQRGWADMPPTSRSLRLSSSSWRGCGVGTMSPGELEWEPVLEHQPGAAHSMSAHFLCFFLSSLDNSFLLPACLFGNILCISVRKSLLTYKPIMSLLCTEPSNGFCFINNKLEASTASGMPFLIWPCVAPLCPPCSLSSSHTSSLAVAQTHQV